MNYRFAIVVGASSGIGFEIVKLLTENNCKVAAIARREDRLKDLADACAAGTVLTYSHDVTKFDEVPELFQTVTKDLGGLDLIIYASGVMPEVGEHEFSFEKDKAMVDVNVLGAIAWLNQAATRFQNTKSGSIVGIGSVAGDRGRSGQPVYNMTKAALTTYLEALRNRLSKLGVHVVTVKPGPVQTEMTEHLKGNFMHPRRAAQIILDKSNKSGEHYLKFTHRVIFFVIRNFPSPIFRRLKV